MQRKTYLVGLGMVLFGVAMVQRGGGQVYPPRWHEDEPAAQVVTPPSLVLAEGHLQFPDGTVQLTAPGSGESLGLAPSPSLFLAEGGLQFPDGTVQSTAAGSLVPRTGVTVCYDNVGGSVVDCALVPGQDGDLQRGAPWPSPRFTINENRLGLADGTVTDNLTGLVWLRDANCFGADWQGWGEALNEAIALASGHDCATDGDGLANLTDESAAGDWRMPNLRELQSLVHYGVTQPAVPDTTGSSQLSEGDPFWNVENADYWSATPSAPWGNQTWVVGMDDGGFDLVSPTSQYPYLWPVRDGR